MPTYVFINNKTDEKEEHTMKMSQLSSFKENNPHLSQTIADVNIGDPVVMGRKTIDPGFKEVLTSIGDRSPGGKGLSDYVKNRY